MAYYFMFGTSASTIFDKDLSVLGQDVPVPVLMLPVTPGALNIRTPSQNTTVNLINDGEINILKKQGLREISFEFMLPQQRYPFANYSLFNSNVFGDYLSKNYTATTMIPLINLLKESNQVFQFVVTRMTPSGKILFYTNIKCQIEDFEYDEDADANGFDVMCNIVLKEYKHYGTATVNIKETESGKIATKVVSRQSSKVIPKTYTVKKGDTLWNICKKHLGDGQKYKEIAKLNKISNPNLIYPNQVLRFS